MRIQRGSGEASSLPRRKVRAKDTQQSRKGILEDDTLTHFTRKSREDFRSSNFQPPKRFLKRFSNLLEISKKIDAERVCHHLDHTMASRSHKRRSWLASRWLTLLALKASLAIEEEPTTTFSTSSSCTWCGFRNGPQHTPARRRLFYEALWNICLCQWSL